MLDAQLNRAVEGIRVLEDFARFEGNNRELSATMRDLRHRLRILFKDKDSHFLAARESQKDVGIVTSATTKNDIRKDFSDIIPANFRRAQEATRGVEESAKALGLYEQGKEVEKIRFALYVEQKKYESCFIPSFPSGVYGITDEKFSNGRDALFQVKEMCRAGIPIIQYREKYREMRYKFNMAKEIRKVTYDYGTKLIIDDHVDIALAVDADGVHIGQEDIPALEVRQLLGPRKMIGLSTHAMHQLTEASTLPIDYVGVGPIYSTQTKVNVCAPVGLSYLEEAVAANLKPFVAIGGIKEANLEAVLERGAKTVCLVTEIIGADNIYEVAKRLHERVINFQGENNEQ